MLLPDVMASLGGLAPHLPYPATKKMMSKLAFFLLYVALLRLSLRLIIRSASSVHLLLLYLPSGTPPRLYSKMFVGGLSWDIADGTLSLAHSAPPPTFAMSYSILPIYC